MKMPGLLRITIYLAGIAFVIFGLISLMNGIQALSTLTPVQKGGLLLALGMLLIIFSHKKW